MRAMIAHLAVWIGLTAVYSTCGWAQDEAREEEIPAEAPSKQKDERPKSFRRKDIDFEDRVVEGVKKQSLDADGLLKSDRVHPDLHKKRQNYRTELNDRVKELEYLR